MPSIGSMGLTSLQHQPGSKIFNGRPVNDESKPNGHQGQQEIEGGIVGDLEPRP